MVTKETTATSTVLIVAHVTTSRAFVLVTKASTERIVARPAGQVCTRGPRGYRSLFMIMTTTRWGNSYISSSNSTFELYILEVHLGGSDECGGRRLKLCS